MNKVEEIRHWLLKAAQANVIVIGEPIIDRYVFVRPLGKSTKENIVTFEPVSTVDYEGGGWIVTSDVAEFAHSASYRDGTVPPILKQRYVDFAFKTKLFSLIEMNRLEERAGTLLPIPTDIILVADYGHGLLRESAIKQLCAAGGFIALTVQSNSANWGFNLLTKWPRANYVVVDQNELRLACHDQYGEIERLAWQQHERMGTTMFAVTLGHEGCLVLNSGDAIRASAVAKNVVDRMGAGDAFLAATAPLVWAGAPANVVATVGNIAGAIKVSKVGNQVVTRREVEEWLTETRL